MLKKSIAMFAPMLAWGAMALGGIAFGQSCGTDFGGGCGGGGSTNCGREITHAEAAGLWSNYCNETCFDFRSNRHCGLRGGGCANGGCFGYGGSDCGTCDNGMAGGRGRLLGGRGGDCGCAGGHRAGGRLFGGGQSGGGANCHGYPGGGFGNCSDGCGGGSGANRGGCGLFNHGGCGLFSRGGAGGCGGRAEGRPFRFLTGGNSPGLFARSAANCGSCGGYFNEPVGYEYGTAGMVSSIAGCGTDFAAPGCNGGGSVGGNQGYSAQPAESGLMLPPQEPASNIVPSTTEPPAANSH